MPGSTQDNSWIGVFARPLFVLLCLTFVPSHVCAISEAITPLVQESSTQRVPLGFETLQPAQTKDLLPANLLKSDYHEVGSEATPDGWWYRYTMNSPFGTFKTWGQDMLCIRVHEVQALAKMEKDMHRPAAFGYRVLETVLSPFQFLWQLITKPKETLSRVPTGMKRVGSRLGEMVTGTRGTFDDGDSQEGVGYGRDKRTIAAAVGVNVYSSNAVLQEHLDDMAAAGYADNGDSPQAVTPMSEPGDLTGPTASFSQAMNEILLDHAPEDLQQINREILRHIGVRQEVRETFLTHPWYSPRHQTILVHALDEMNDVHDRRLILHLAIQAKSEEEALFVQRFVEMFASYHQTVVSLQAFSLIKDQLLVGQTTDWAVVVVLPLSHLAWTHELAEATEAVVHWTSKRPSVQRVELWTSGKTTKHTHDELEKRGIMIFEKKRPRLLPPVIPEPLPFAGSGPSRRTATRQF